ncbi:MULTISPECIES: ISAon1 family transposase N-terminal region protein [Muribaculaceae]|uniref:ISAon1 family transposase N-terminal region protein n=1 Tax=Muribaculaceae TaxID=2005473 RepID=UPI0025B6EE7D|nr:hypothetical protein [Paramuribaculum intestinale]
MKPDQLLRSILPEVLIDNFDIDRFEKSDSRFDIWLDEKNEQLREDKYNKNIISYGFGDYRTIQDYPIRVRHIPACAEAQVAGQIHRRIACQ